jgi:hypothetical protein
MVYTFTLPYALTYSRLFNRSKHVAVGMKDKMLVCGVHLIGEHYLAPEVPIVSLRAGYLTSQERDAS